MGRRKKNPKELDARGSYLQNPSRRPKNFNPLAPAPQPTAALGDPPSRLSDEMKEVWRELAAQVNPASVTAAGDVKLFEVLVSLTHKFQTGKSYNASLLVSLTTRFLETSQTGVAPKPPSKLEAFLAKGRAQSAAFAQQLEVEALAGELGEEARNRAMSKRKAERGN